MTVEYELKLQDLTALHQFTLSSSAIARRNRNVMWLGVPGALVLLTAISASVRGIRPGDAFPILVALPWLALWPTYQRWAVNRAVKRTYRDRADGILGRHSISLSSEGVREKTEVGETFSTWQGIYRVAATDSHVFLYIAPLLAHVIPNSAFKDDKSKTDFVEMAKHCLSSPPSIRAGSG